MIRKLELENFAAFKRLELEFSPKINVIIGENSCGKTQLIKAVYALASPSENLSQQLLSLFKPKGDVIAGLYHNGGEGEARILIEDGLEHVTQTSFTVKSKKLAEVSNSQLESKAIFIPTREVLSLLSAIHNQQVDDTGLRALFDSSVIDLFKALMEEPVHDIEGRINADPRFSSIARMLVNAIKGKYVVDGGEQYFVGGSYVEKKDADASKSKHAQMYRDNSYLEFRRQPGSETSITMTAEGYRKVGLLQRLLENGSLELSQTGILLWDEPESNMNPGLMKMIVQCLLELSRNGQQIIIATHNYVLLKWFDLLIDEGQGDHIKYHALFRDSRAAIASETNEDYKHLSANAIAKTYSDLYDAEIERSFGGSK